MKGMKAKTVKAKALPKAKVKRARMKVKAKAKRVKVKAKTANPKATLMSLHLPELSLPVLLPRPLGLFLRSKT